MRGVDAWNHVRRAFPDDGNGSRIILTTGSLDLASSIGHVHEMSLLDEDRSWNLIRERIFKGDPCPFQLESVGKAIARSCGGHPLSIEVVSGILASDQTEATGADVSENIKNIVSDEDDFKIFGILSLSYTYLPHHPRPCFLYLGSFRRCHEIRVSKLIKLWAAEGFLIQSESKSFQEMGEEHVEDLVRKKSCFVEQEAELRASLHSDVSEMCRIQAHTSDFIHKVNSYGRYNLGSGRRVSSSDFDGDFLENANYASIIHSYCNLTIRRSM